MSILDTIVETESEASGILAEANAEAQKLVRAADAETAEKAAAELKAARETAAAQVEQARADAEKKAAAYVTKEKANYEQMANKARERLPQAVELLVGKVVNQA